MKLDKSIRYLDKLRHVPRTYALNKELRWVKEGYTVISIKVVPKKREKVEYERERLIGKD